MSEKKTGHRWQPGQSGNPAGRPRGIKNKKTAGRVLAMRALDEMLEVSDNVLLLRQHMAIEFRRDPIAFYERFVMPLLPRNAQLQLPGGQDDDGANVLRIVFEEAQPNSEEERGQDTETAE